MKTRFKTSYRPILTLSWKNIWRNPIRSAVVMLAVILGTWSGIFSTALMNGLSMQYIKNELDNSIPHLQIIDRDYLNEAIPAHVISSIDSLNQILNQKPFILFRSNRSLANGLISSASSSFGVTIKGIDVQSDTLVSNLNTFLIRGRFLNNENRNQILIGKKLSSRLNLDVRSRVVLNFQDISGTLTAGAFRIVGIFDSHNSRYDQQHVFVNRPDLNRLLGDKDAVHEIVLKVDNFKKADEYRDNISSEIRSNNSIKSWGDISPALRYTDSNVDLMLYIFMTIIFIALTFGIINTMLMAVLERTRELGMLMAVGINKLSIFIMIMSETLLLTLAGVPIGMAFSLLTMSWINQTGINLNAFAEGLKEYGLSTVIYPELPEGYFLNIGLILLFLTLFSAIYPSFKALRLNPVQAIRKV